MSRLIIIIIRTFFGAHCVYLSLPRYGVLKQEVCALRPVLVDVVAVGTEQEALAGIVGEGRGRRGGHRLVAGVPAPVAAGGAAVAGRQRLLPGWLRYCSWERETHTWCTVVEEQTWRRDVAMMWPR